MEGNKEISITNNAFRFSKEHPLLLIAFKQVIQKYQPECWTCIGPLLITKSARELAKTKKVEEIPASAGFSYIAMEKIMSVRSVVSGPMLFPEKPVAFNKWREVFAHSSAVHFFGHHTSDLAVHDHPQFSAYALLGPRYCPLSYYSTNNF